ncbi:ADP-ribosylation/Crystallin J1 [Pacmanvirus A23]|uniref:ADP-ribosylglycohydrolase n=1 Tax=Pacmanvirus A23 TaxID=1932881 RepID=UPI000A094DAE|nr:ADP-ribosylglycohydrolase [Pacmanvirus A23]SIP86068.1 ADP-ribosylation/Crystallin J1 [Pacmanvirus A23]
MSEEILDNLTKSDPRINKIIGAIYGHALGDAVGLQTEYKFKRNNPRIEFPYTESIRDFPVCDWTDDTDHLILIMLSMIENDFQFNSTDIAQRLKQWLTNGFKELGDTRGIGVGGPMRMVISHPQFLIEPSTVAREIWQNSGKKMAENGSLMRTSIVGTIPDIEFCEKWAAHLSLLTHADPRCVLSCVFQSMLINYLVYKDIKTEKDMDSILTAAIANSRKYIDAYKEFSDEQKTQDSSTTDEELSHWVQTAYTKNISELKLDEMVKVGYVFKSLACSVYILQVIKVAIKNNSVPSFKKVIYKIASECGDADTNCAVAGATLGSYLGYNLLPKEWLNALPNKKWLDEIIVLFVNKLVSKQNPNLNQCSPESTDQPENLLD